MKNINEKQIMKMVELYSECEARLPLLAEEFGAAHYDCSMSLLARSDSGSEAELTFDCHVHLTFGKHANYGIGSYVSIDNGFDKAEETLRNMYKDYLKKSEEDERKKAREELKNLLLSEYLKNQVK